MNAFESGARKSIPATLIYARIGDDVLMIHRNAEAKREADYHSGKWNGLGGKCEADESPLEAAVREFHEESGLQVESDRFRSLGVLTFPNFKAHKSEDWVVFVFIVELSESMRSQVRTSTEGDLHWVPSQDLLKLNLWPGDRHFIPYVRDQKPFIGTIWYRGQEVERYWMQELA